MKARAVTLILLFLFPIFAGVGAATNEGYGEDQTSLGQTVDTFDTSDNISIAVDVIRNSTLEVIELNYTAGAGSAYEDLTAWIEVDVPGDLTVNSTFVKFTTMRRDSTALIYRDFGAGYFNDFMYNFTHVFESNEAGDGSNVAAYWAVAMGNSTTRVGLIAGEMIAVEMGQLGLTDNRVRYRLLQRKAGAWTVEVNDVTYYSPFTHYCSLYRVGANLTLDVYTDSARTVLIEHLTSGGADLDTYQYVHAAVGYDAAGDPADHATGYIGMIDLGESAAGYEPEGYFTTTDYFDNPNINGSGLALLINSSLPALTDIKIQISKDNANWTDHEGTLGNSVDLLGGFEAIDLRDLNYSANIYFRGNLSTTDSTVTPRVYQIRLITMIGAGGGIPGIDVNVTGAWEYYNLSAIQTITGTHDHGLVNDTYWVDTLTFQCSEVVGVPGYEVKFNITGIDPAAISLWLVNYVWYKGSASHEVNVELWNYTSSAYVEIGEIPDMLALDWQNFTIYPLRIPLEFVNSSGVMVGRFYHADAGNINHDIIFDRISLHAFIPTAAAEESFQFFWIVIAIALMLIGLVLSKMWFDGKDP